MFVLLSDDPYNENHSSFRAGVRSDNVHVEVRKKLMRDSDSRHLRTDLELHVPGNGDRALEDILVTMLKAKNGPKTVLTVFFNDGSAMEFFKLMAFLVKSVDFVSFSSEKMRNLELLDNSDNRYYIGRLRNKAGNFSQHNLKLTVDGKMQVFLNGNGPLEVAMRNAVGKSWLEKCVNLENEEKRQRMEYNKEHAQLRSLSQEYFNDQLKMMVDQGDDLSSAKMKLRSVARLDYQALVPVFKSGTDAKLCANDQLSEQDALKCAEGRDNEVSIGPEGLKILRKTVKSVADSGTQIFHMRQGDIRFQASLLMKQGVDPFEAHQIVSQQCRASGWGVFKDRDGKPLPPKEQADLYFNKNKDLEGWKQTSMMPQIQPPALPPTPGRTFGQQESLPPPPPQHSPLGSGRSVPVTGAKRRLAVGDSAYPDDPFDTCNMEGPSTSRGTPGWRRYQKRT